MSPLYFIKKPLSDALMNGLEKLSKDFRKIYVTAYFLTTWRRNCYADTDRQIDCLLAYSEGSIRRNKVLECTYLPNRNIFNI